MLPLLPQAKLSVMRAMLGEITPEMRAVTVEVNARHVTVRVYHDELASDELWDDFDAAMTEVYADFPADGPDAISLDYKLLRCDSPQLIPALGEPVFVRKGTRFRNWSLGDSW
jgi:hypothetical protein